MLAPISGMPLHLVAMFLSRPDDVRSLGSAIRSHPCFYSAFKDAPKKIMWDVLNNKIPPETFRFAITLHKTTVQCPDFGDILEEQLAHPNLAPCGGIKPVDLEPSLHSKLSRTHDLVENFTQGFGDLHLGISAWERYRIYREFYLFEVYYTVVWNKGKLPRPVPWGWNANRPGVAGDIFVDYCSEWVI
ncbi:hypothetical protein VTI74DRAFT_9714 [Chaetomium olivicolor]